jgi:hypothetical protein
MLAKAVLLACGQYPDTVSVVLGFRHPYCGRIRKVLRTIEYFEPRLLCKLDPG